MTFRITHRQLTLSKSDVAFWWVLRLFIVPRQCSNTFLDVAIAFAQCKRTLSSRSHLDLRNSVCDDATKWVNYPLRILSVDKPYHFQVYHSKWSSWVTLQQSKPCFNVSQHCWPSLWGLVRQVKIQILLQYKLEPFWGWKKTPKGKPPGIGCEGWKTSHMRPGIEPGSGRSGDMTWLPLLSVTSR